VRADKTQPQAAAHPPVARLGLASRVQASNAAVLLLVAPAGFGKTTAMAQLRQQWHGDGLATAWLTLDRGDNDPQRFLGGLREALQALQPAAEPRATLLPFDPFEAAARSGRPFALFLDDFECIAADAVVRLVRDLVEQLPRGSRLVIGSRRQPDLGLARLRTQGRVLELDAASLRFSDAESRELLALRQAPALSAADHQLLQAKTEGWPAAMALAAMALQHHGSGSQFIRRFSGSTQAVADYLSEDVLDRQPAELREFLLATSILRQLDAPVCQALLPRLDCAYVLQRLQASNLFLVPIAGRPGHWRYHTLFSDFLRVQLLRHRPHDCQRLHLAASAWYEAQDRIVPAIDHALEGGDPPHALHLLAQHGQRFLAEGRLRLLARWFAAIPGDALRARPLVQVVSLWATAFTQGAFEAMQQLDASGCMALDDPQVRAHVAALHCAWLVMQDRPVEAHAAGREALARVPTGQPYADNLLCIVMAHLMAQMGERHEAHQLLDAARVRQGDSLFMRMYIESVEGEQDLQDGALRQATARFRIAVSATRAASHDHTSGNAWAGVLYACSLYEANQLAQAERLLRVYLPVVQPMGLQDHVILASLCLARIARARGDIDDAVRQLTDLESLGHAQGLVRLVASARLERARVLMHQGRADAAASELARADQPEAWRHERQLRRLAHSSHDPLLGRLRWAVHFGDPQHAFVDLASELAWSNTHRRPLRALVLSLLQAVVLRRLGREHDALAQLAQTLAGAAEQGFVRLVLDEGPLVVALLPALLRHVDARAGDADPLLTDYLRQLLEAAGPQPAEPGAPAQRGPGRLPAGLLEKLTPKEMQALQLLAEGYSNLAMAERLGVSENTVRTHLRNVNAKLDVRSRTQAVARARQLGLLR